jgi:hypothetical protein
MKVDWDRIIRENHNPSRVSRRVAKLVGGYIDPDDPEAVGDPSNLAIKDEISGSSATWGETPSHFLTWEHYKEFGQGMRNLLMLDYASDKAAQRQRVQANSNFRRAAVAQYMVHLANERAARNAQFKIDEAAYDAKEIEEDRKIVLENEAYGAFLRDQQKQLDMQSRAQGRMRTTVAQNTARQIAAQQGSAAIRADLAKMKEAAVADAAARANNLKSIQTLATERAAIAAAEAAQQRAIKANSAQTLANQSAEMARLRAEAAAKQAQLAQRVPAPAPTVPARVRIVRAPQVRFGGVRRRKDRLD